MVRQDGDGGEQEGPQGPQVRRGRRTQQARAVGHVPAGALPDHGQADVDHRQEDGGDQPRADGGAGHLPGAVQSLVPQGLDDHDTEHGGGQDVHGQVALREPRRQGRARVGPRGGPVHRGGAGHGRHAQHGQEQEQRRGEPPAHPVRDTAGAQCHQDRDPQEDDGVDEQGRAPGGEAQQLQDGPGGQLVGHGGHPGRHVERANGQVDGQRHDDAEPGPHAPGQPENALPRGGHGHDGGQGQQDARGQEPQEHGQEVAPGGGPDHGREDEVPAAEEQGEEHQARGQDGGGGAAWRRRGRGH